MMERNKVLEEYFKKEYNNLCKKVARRAGSPENAEDVVQEAFYRALKYWNSYNPATKIGAWFNTILNNACKDKMRDERMAGASIEFEEELFDGVEMSQTDANTAEHIRKLINAKPYPLCEVLRLYYEKGYKSIEIKQILDVEHGTVRQAVWRFKEEVREKLHV